MFSGLGNQISGFVSQKMGKEAAPADGTEPEMQAAAPAENGAEGEVPAEGGAGALGGAMGFAQGLMAKAAMAKEGITAKAGGLQVVNHLYRITIPAHWYYNLYPPSPSICTVPSITKHTSFKILQKQYEKSNCSDSVLLT